ncbi:MAG: hydrogenase expression/formation protein HypE, partial [Candidatus Omnitrophica bacterium]|nr:hydrogenase expression/formation protein HypE [Candidatus Omnitrophota bacterium]
MKPRAISIGHGSGGRLTQELIKELLLSRLRNPIISELSDAAVLPYPAPLAFTTDTFVVRPLFFRGGDIGKLAVCGTVNDLVVQGAVPEYLSLALIMEEGLEYRILQKIADSLAQHAKKAGVRFVTGDIKVVEKGACDRLFINTSGVGRIIARPPLSVRAIRPQDRIIITSDIGRHGLAIAAERNAMDARLGISSDCASLAGLILPVLKKTKGIRFMRDATRGGVATVLNEIAQGSGLGLSISEAAIPVSSKVKAACELFGF